MTWDHAAQTALSAAAHLPEVRQLELEATQRLLGDTIAVSEQAWQEPSRLPGWTRAHVATHIARNADAMVRSVDAVLMGRRALMYDSDEDRELAIERGSERTGLELQIDLDTSAGRLNHKFNSLEGVPPQFQIEILPGRLVRADLLPLARLNEVVLHHVDLDCGFEIVDLDPKIARWLLEWNALSLEDSDVPAVEIHSASGFNRTFGRPEDAFPVRGPDAALLGWLTGRLAPDQAEVLGFPEQPKIA